ncbi:MAG: methyltransferase domain-containing protein [Desulfobacterales bacterium]
MTEHTPDGVLDQNYAYDRMMKPELRWRLATRARVIVDAARRFLHSQRGLMVLDMGCAEGRTMLEISAQLPDSVLDGVEYSTDLVEAAVALPECVRIWQGDITALPTNISAESYDIVSALAVLEHLSTPVSAVREAQRVLKSGGIFVATSPSPAWDHLSATLGLLKGDAHVFDVNKSFLMEIVREAGLEPLEYRRFMWAPVAFLPYLHIRPSPRLALRVDRIVEGLRFLNWMFANQAIIARKPLHDKEDQQPNKGIEHDR